MDEEDLKAELTCPICMDLFREPRRLPCGHVYCRVCLQDMLTRKYLNTRASERILSCPECRQKYDLTFQEMGVDVFTRDFKLFRLVELFQKKFSRGQENEAGDVGADARADDQTAVKSLCSTSCERESSPQTSPPAEPSVSSSSSSSQLPAARHSQSQEWQEGGVASFDSSSASLSDDSWIYVTPDSHHRLSRPTLTPALRASRHHRSDDTWLLPSTDLNQVRFPVEPGTDLRGSADADVTYRTLSESEENPTVHLSGRYDNAGPETFQRFAADEPSLQVVRLPRGPHPRVTSPSSDSSSESESSDERGDEGSEERSADEVSRSGSDAGSRGRNKRSRLSRFIRSLVMSDSDSYDDDEQAFNGVQHPRAFPDRRAEYMQRCSPMMATARPVVGESGAEMELGVGAHGLSYYENREPLPHRSRMESHSRPGVGMGDGENVTRCNNPDTGSMGEAGRSCRTGVGEGPSYAQGGGTDSTGRAAPSSSRGRMAADGSDGSDDDYEPQTSMLRPRRKPRSRLKKFFTSLLSLSSSDDDDDEVEAVEGQAAPSTPEKR